MDKDPVRLVVKHTFLELECNDEAPVEFRRNRRSSDAGVRYGRFQGDHQDELTEAAVEYAAEHPNSPMRVPAAARTANDFTPLETAQEPSSPASPKRLPSRNKVTKMPHRQQPAPKMPSREQLDMGGFSDEEDPRLERWEAISRTTSGLSSRTEERRRSSQLSALSILTDDSFESGDISSLARYRQAPPALLPPGSSVGARAPASMLHGPPGQLSAGGPHDNYIDGMGPPAMHGPPGQHGYVPPCPPYPPYVPGAGQMGYCEPWWRQQNQQYGAAPGWPPVPYNIPPPNPLDNARPHGGMPARDAAARGNSSMVAPSGGGVGPVQRVGEHVGHMHALELSGNAGAGGCSGGRGNPYATGGYSGVPYGNAHSGMMATAGTSAGSADAVVAGTQTTVMLRNLPESYSRNMLVSLLDRHGFRGKYDFVYMPMNFRTKASFGYAFVNFVMPPDAQCCHTEFQGFASWEVTSQKVCDVSWSNMHQGLAAHIERYRNSPVMHESVPDEYKPAVYAKGHRAVFPGPTKKLRVPRIRRPNADADGDDLDEMA